MENAKERFLSLCKENIKREGIDKFLEWLETTDFFTAPASTKFHSNKEGGLLEHSLNVYDRLLKNLKNEYGDFEKVVSLESATIIALFHDICKVNYFVKETRNVKEYRENGLKQDSKGRFDWVEKDVYAVDEELPYGHGEKSVYILSGFMKLTREEALSINWHMGGFDLRTMSGSYAMSNAFYKYPIAFLTHVSDMEATYLDEICEK